MRLYTLLIIIGLSHVIVFLFVFAVVYNHTIYKCLYSDTRRSSKRFILIAIKIHVKLISVIITIIVIIIIIIVVI